MIRASRTAFVENPDGSIQCVVTIPRESRAAALEGAPVALSALPAEPLSATKIEGTDAVTFPTNESIMKSMLPIRERMARETMAALDKRPGWMGVDYDGDDMTVTIEKEKAESAADRPPAQTVGVAGFDAASVVEAVTSGSYTWDHPAAPYMATIFRHEPFQRFAMMRLHADAFAAPMECATRFITKAVKGKPMDAAIAALTARMNEYIGWAGANFEQMWPNGSKS